MIGASLPQHHERGLTRHAGALADRAGFETGGDGVLEAGSVDGDWTTEHWVAHTTRAAARTLLRAP